MKTGHVAHNYEVRLISICGMCLSDLLLVDYQKSINWLTFILEPYLLKLNELALLKQTDKITQAQTCHILNLVSQFMSSLIQRQQSHNGDESNNTQNESVSIGNTSFNNGNASGNIISANNELTIAYSILIKVVPIYKVFINRNLPNDLVIVNKIFESISVVLSSSISSSNSSFFNNNETIDLIINDLVQMFFALNENAWGRYVYEVCRQVIAK